MKTRRGIRIAPRYKLCRTIQEKTSYQTEIRDLVRATSLAIIFVLATFSSVPAVAKAANSSVYVDIRLKSCKKQTKSVPDFVRYRCGIAAGWRVYLAGEEGTTTITLERNGAERDIGITDFTNGDIATGDNLELRLHNGTLYSTVVRLNEYQTKTRVRSILLVSKIGSTESCVVAIVEPGDDQAAQAREGADKAASLDCIDA